MSSWIALVIAPIILTVAIGVAVSWMLARWLPVRAKTKAIVFGAAFVVLFTPVLMPAGIAGIFLPAMGIGLAIFWWHPWNYVSVPVAIALAVGLAYVLFLRSGNRAGVEAGHA